MTQNLTWNIHGRLIGSRDYFLRRDWISDPEEKKLGNATYLVCKAFDVVGLIRTEQDFLNVFGPLEDALNYYSKKKETGFYNDKDNFKVGDWVTELNYISDRWTSPRRTEWLIFLIQHLEEKQHIKEDYKKAGSCQSDIESFEELI